MNQFLVILCQLHLVLLHHFLLAHPPHRIVLQPHVKPDGLVFAASLLAAQDLDHMCVWRQFGVFFYLLSQKGYLLLAPLESGAGTDGTHIVLENVFRQGIRILLERLG